MAVVTIGVYSVGAVATVSAVFTDTTGAAADPTTVSASVRSPDGIVTSYSYPGGIVKDSTGNYHLTVTLDQAGDWFYRFVGTGAVAAVQEGTLTVREQETTAAGPLSASALTSLGAAREYVLRDETDGSNDRQLIRLINAYSQAVIRYTHRQWFPVETGVAHKFNYDGSGFLSLSPYEATSVTSVVLFTDLPDAAHWTLPVASSTVEGGWRLNPRGGTPEGTYLWLDLPGISRMRGLFSPYDAASWWEYNPAAYTVTAARAGLEVTVTGNWGIGSVPDDVELAVLVAIKDAYENPTGYASGTEGGLQFAEEPDTTIGAEANARNLPVESRSLLSDYARPRVARFS